MAAANGESSATASGAGAPVPYAGEVRFGLVLYGGVSLAVYINGFTGELFELCCATPREGFNESGNSKPSATREVYKRLSRLIGDHGLINAYAEAIRSRDAGGHWSADPPDVWDAIGKTAAPHETLRTRFCVDVIAGSSAGGINGIYLAKALACGLSFSPLKDLWMKEGDIGNLVFDKRSYKDLDLGVDRRDRSPPSLLNGDRMYLTLESAFKDMQEKGCLFSASDAAPQARGSPLSDDLEVHLTTTDIRGSPVALRLSDRVAYERRYKQSFRFQFPGSTTGEADADGDFSARNNPILAFAARCTSAFPFAFEPMTLARLGELSPSARCPSSWAPFFPNLPPREVTDGRLAHRAFGDGGYLDNKPFSYVVDALAARKGSVSVERKLLYVEPAPEREAAGPADGRRNDAAVIPDAIENALAALLTIPGYEPIREDLQRVLQRNRRIERVERLVRRGESFLDSRPYPIAPLLIGFIGRNWADLTLSDMLRAYGDPFFAYQQLRVFSVTDELAARLGVRWGVDPESDQQYALRALVRAWREERFEDEGTGAHQTTNAFLDQFDFDYRVRRLDFLMRQMSVLNRALRKRARDAPPRQYSEQEEHALGRIFAVDSPAPAGAAIRAMREALERLHANLQSKRAALLKAHIDTEAAAVLRARKSGLPAELDAILILIVDGKPVGESSSWSSHYLATVGRLGDGEMQRATASRTLQEEVFTRAAKVLNANSSPLSKCIVDELESMRVKLAPTTATVPAHLWGQSVRAAASAVRPALGNPRWRCRPTVGIDVDAHPIDTADRLEADRLRALFAGLYLRFDTYDQISFPLYYDTGTGEPATVEVVRVSPMDATSLVDERTGRRKLAGTAFAHFGAFLDRNWRLNDYMWGRLDGAERLIQTLLPGDHKQTAKVRVELIRLAHERILHEELGSGGQTRLTGALVHALREVGSNEPNQAAVPARIQSVRQIGHRLASRLGLASTAAGVDRRRAAEVLDHHLNGASLVDYVKQFPLVEREPDPKTTLDAIARSVTVTGRILEGISAKYGAGTTLPRWIARAGLLLQTILVAATPGALRQRPINHGLKLIVAVALLNLLLGAFVETAPLQSTSLFVLAMALAFRLLTMITRDLLRRRNFWVRLTACLTVASLLGFVGAGMHAFWGGVQMERRCWAEPAADAALHAGSPLGLCRPIRKVGEWVKSL